MDPLGLESVAVLFVPRPGLHRADRLVEGDGGHGVAFDLRLLIVDGLFAAADTARVAEGVRGRDGDVHLGSFGDLGEHALHRHVQPVAHVHGCVRLGEIITIHSLRRGDGINTRGVSGIGRPVDVFALVGEGERLIGIFLVEPDVHRQAVLHGLIVVADAEVQSVGPVFVVSEVQIFDAVILVGSIDGGLVIEPWGALEGVARIADAAVGADGDDLVGGPLVQQRAAPAVGVGHHLDALALAADRILSVLPCPGKHRGPHCVHAAIRLEHQLFGVRINGDLARDSVVYRHDLVILDVALAAVLIDLLHRDGVGLTGLEVEVLAVLLVRIEGEAHAVVRRAHISALRGGIGLDLVINGIRNDLDLVFCICCVPQLDAVAPGIGVAAGPRRFMPLHVLFIG